MKRRWRFAVKVGHSFAHVSNNLECAHAWKGAPGCGGDERWLPYHVVKGAPRHIPGVVR